MNQTAQETKIVVIIPAGPTENIKAPGIAKTPEPIMAFMPTIIAI